MILTAVFGRLAVRGVSSETGHYTLLSSVVYIVCPFARKALKDFFYVDTLRDLASF